MPTFHWAFEALHDLNLSVPACHQENPRLNQGVGVLTCGEEEQKQRLSHGHAIGYVQVRALA
jgi:hypothetical protein